VISADDVRYGYRFMLGREVESDDVIQNALLAYPTFEALRAALLASEEFRFAQAVRAGSALRHPFPDAPPQVVTRLTPAQRARLITATIAQRIALGETEPHWSTMPQDAFRAARMDETTRAAFEETGKVEVERFLAALKRGGIAPGQLRHCVELGCGVGRLTRVLAGALPRVTGTEVSASHLAVARSGLDAAGLETLNLVLLNGAAAFERVPRCDALVSIGWLQLLPPPVACYFLERMLERLNPGGIAYLQLVTGLLGYAYDAATAEPPAPGEVQTHAIPQPALFALLAEQGCNLVEIREDPATSPQLLSNTLLARKQSGRR